MTARDMRLSLQTLKSAAPVAVAVPEALVLVLDEDYRAVEMSPAFEAGCGLTRGDCVLHGLPVSRSVFVQYCEHARRTGEPVDLVEFGGGRVLHIRVVARDERFHTSWETVGILDTLTIGGLSASLRTMAETLAGTEDTLRRERLRRSLRLVGGGG
jgi:PAS domain-containing protein